MSDQPALRGENLAYIFCEFLGLPVTRFRQTAKAGDALYLQFDWPISFPDQAKQSGVEADFFGPMTSYFVKGFSWEEFVGFVIFHI